MSHEKSISELAKEFADKSEASAKTAEMSNQEAAKSAALVLAFSKAIGTIEETISEEKKSPPETKGKSIHAYLDDYDFYTGKASDINRSLALAGIATIWIFRNTAVDQPLFTNSLLIPLWFLVISLSLDLLQYFLGAIIWGIFYEVKYHFWKRTKTISDENAKDIEAPNFLSFPLVIVFFAKIAFMVLAYYNLFIFLQSKIDSLK